MPLTKYRGVNEFQPPNWTNPLSENSKPQNLMVHLFIIFRHTYMIYIYIYIYIYDINIYKYDVESMRILSAIIYHY